MGIGNFQKDVIGFMSTSGPYGNSAWWNPVNPSGTGSQSWNFGGSKGGGGEAVNESMPPGAIVDYFNDNPDETIPVTVSAAYRLYAHRVVKVWNRTQTVTDAWHWLFNLDGSLVGESTLENPSFQFAADGVANIGLRAWNGDNYREYSIPQFMVTDLPEQASFDMHRFGLTMVFVETSTIIGTSFLWNFGDGTTSTAQNPVHTYAAEGIYTVTLSVNGAYVASNTFTLDVDGLVCLDTFTDANGTLLENHMPDIGTSWHKILTSWGYPREAWEIQGNTLHCTDLHAYYEPPLYKQHPLADDYNFVSMQFGAGQQGLLNFNWRYTGDSEDIAAVNKYYALASYTSPTTMQVAFYGMNGNGEQITAASSEFSVTEGQPYTLRIERYYNCFLVYVNDIQRIAPVQAWIPDQCILNIETNSTDPAYSYDTFMAGYSVPQNIATLRSSFIVSSERGMIPFTVTFTNTSTGYQDAGFPATFLWDFGDGNTSTTENPTHTYINGGLYTITLTVSTFYASVSYSRSISAYRFTDVTIPDGGTMGYWIRTDTNYYIIDALHDRILIYDLNLNYQAYFGGTGSGNGQFNGPSYLAWDGTYLYVVDRENDRVQKFNGAGTYQGQFSVPGDPYGIGTNGVYLYITDLETNTVKVYSMGGSYLYSFGAGELLAPAGIWVESNYIYVVDNGKDRVPTFLPSSNELIGYAGYGVHDFLQPTDVRVNGPFLEVIDQAGTRLVSIPIDTSIGTPYALDQALTILKDIHGV
jgi:PKD repeat protein